MAGLTVFKWIQYHSEICVNFNYYTDDDYQPMLEITMSCGHEYRSHDNQDLVFPLQIKRKTYGYLKEHDMVEMLSKMRLALLELHNKLKYGE